jgi:hypothetical protein
VLFPASSQAVGLPPSAAGEETVSLSMALFEQPLPWRPAHAALLAAGQWPVLAPVPHWPVLNSWQQYGLPYVLAAAVLLAFAAVGALLWCWCPSLG